MLMRLDTPVTAAVVGLLLGALVVGTLMTLALLMAV